MPKCKKCAGKLCGKQKSFCSRSCLFQWCSQEYKKRGIRPPSQLGFKMPKASIAKREATFRQRHGVKITPEQREKMVRSKMERLDRIGRISPLLDRLKRTRKYKNWRSDIFR